MSLMEAASLGTPAPLTLDASGVRDSIVNGVTGVLVEAEDGRLSEALAADWVKFADRDYCVTMGRSARVRASQFSWARSVDRWEGLLHAVVGGTARAKGSTDIGLKHDSSVA